MSTTWYFANKLDEFKIRYTPVEQALIQAAYWEGVKQAILLTQLPGENYPRWSKLEQDLGDTLDYLNCHQFTPLTTGIAYAKSVQTLAVEQQTVPVYLTSGCCENAHGSTELFALMGLKAGKFDGQFYPLPNNESRFIAEDMVEGTKAWVYTGYSVLYQGKKWLCPTSEIYYVKPGNKREDYEHETPQKAHKAGLVIKDWLEPRITAIGGHVIFVEELESFTDYRYDLQILIPFDYAQTFGTFFKWKKELTRLLS